MTAAVYAFMGEEAKARKLFEQQQGKGDRVLFSQAILHVALGEHEEAIGCLEKAYEQREMPLEHTMAHVDPLLDPLRSNPKFEVLLKKMNLAD